MPVPDPATAGTIIPSTWRPLSLTSGTVMLIGPKVRPQGRFERLGGWADSDQDRAM